MGLFDRFKKTESTERKMDQAVAFETYLSKAKAGDVQAQCLVAKCYYEGKGVDQSVSDAIDWFTEAAKKDWLRAVNCWGSLYEQIIQSSDSGDHSNEHSRYDDIMEHHLLIKDNLVILVDPVFADNGKMYWWGTAAFEYDHPNGGSNGHTFLSFWYDGSWQFENR